MDKLEKLLEESRGHLDPDEETLSAIVGACGVYEKRTLGKRRVFHGIGVMLATDRRLVFYAKKLGGYELESFRYADISAFKQGKTMAGATVRFFTVGREVRIRLLEARELSGFADAVQARMGRNGEAGVAHPSAGA